MSGEADDDSSLHEGDLPSVLLPNWKEDAGDAVSFPLLFAALVLVVVVMQAWQSGMISKLLRSKGDLMPMVAPRTSPEFIKFQQSYLVAYLFAVTADWLQGPWLYALYEHYKFDKLMIGLLFVAGYISSMIFGTFAGSLADRYGRRLACLCYCILYAASCLTKHSSHFSLLFAGRILGGVSTSILFSSFESWMIAEHNNLNYPQEWLSQTFAVCQLGNGMAAIFAGILGTFFVQITGSLVIPFDLAILLLLACYVTIVANWSAESGATPVQIAETTRRDSRGSKLKAALDTLRREPHILVLGLVQSSFEAAMYVFVFLWTPLLQSAFQVLPYGQVFGCFMAAMMAGSTLVKLVSSSRHHSPPGFLRGVLAVACLSLFIPALRPPPIATLSCFLLFEACVGAYYPSMGVIKSKHVPEEARATIYSLFRVPLNLAVALVLFNLKTYSDDQILACSAGLVLLSTVLQHKFCGLADTLRRRQSSPLN